MLPMTLRCAACGEYLGRGTKFNARKEDAAGERYLGAIQVFRFYIRCPRCSAEIAFKTDPGSSDYAVESGATWGMEPRRGAWDDAMAALEARARAGRREMDADAALEEARSLSARRARVAPAQALESLHNRYRVTDGRDALRELELEADEALVKSIRFRNAAGYLKRIEEEDDRDDEDFLTASLARTVDARHPAHTKKQRQAADRPVVIVSKRRCATAAAPADRRRARHTTMIPRRRRRAKHLLAALSRRCAAATTAPELMTDGACWLPPTGKQAIKISQIPTKTAQWPCSICTIAPYVLPLWLVVVHHASMDFLPCRFGNESSNWQSSISCSTWDTVRAHRTYVGLIPCSFSNASLFFGLGWSQLKSLPVFES